MTATAILARAGLPPDGVGEPLSPTGLVESMQPCLGKARAARHRCPHGTSRGLH
jgi:hypothetical protein